MADEMTSERLAQSIKDKLKASAKQSGRSMNYALAAYAIKGFLRRAALSKHNGKWAMKGGNLMFVWTEDAGRPTFDLDLESLDSDNLSAEEVAAIYDEIAAIHIDDGLDLRMDKKKLLDMTGEGVLGHSIVGAVRLGECVIKMKIDFGFGEVITPRPAAEEFPALFRGDDRVPMLAYTRQTVIAEKLHAMTKLGLQNTRLKDYYDIYHLTKLYELPGESMKNAVKATFAARNSRRAAGRSLDISSDMEGLSDAFADRWAKQWASWAKSGNLDTDLTLHQVVHHIRNFAVPLMQSIESGEDLPDWNPAHQTWEAPELEMAP